MSSENSIYLLFLLVVVSLILEITGEKICQNSGTLLKNDTCLCTSDYQGETCETRKTVWNGLPDCKHGSWDFGTTTDFRFKYGCKCWENWEGDLCDLPICKNDGTRINGTCECYGDWIGQHCEKKDCDQYRKWSKSENQCICKKKGWEGVRCHLPICKEGTRVIHSNGTGSCECWEPELWFGELCDESICHKGRGEPYFHNLENNTETTVKCKCNDGWKGDDCSTKDCHGHGRAFGFSCLCDDNYNILDDCATCAYGYTGKNCKQRKSSIYTGGSSSSNNYGSGSSYGSDDDDYSLTKKSTNWGSFIGILSVIGIVSCILLSLRKLCQRSSSPPPAASRTYYSHAAVTNPVPQHLRHPQPYGGPTPTDPRGNLYANYSTNNGNFSSNLSDPVSSERTTNHWRVQVNGLDVGASAPPADPEVHDPPPPEYGEVTEEPLPPSYEEAVKAT